MPEPTTRSDSLPDPDSPSRPRLLELSLPQIAGGALAAATAAALGSSLGVAGTVMGAAVASVVAAVAGALYTASLRRTHTGVRTAWQRVARRDHAPGEPAPGGPADSARAETGEVLPDPGTRRRIRPAAVVVGALAAFAMAGVLVTSAELITGRTLEGGSGTTIGQATRGQWGRPGPATSPTSPAADPSTPAASDSASAEPSQPGATPSAPTAPTPTESASTGPAPTEPAPTEPSSTGPATPGPSAPGSSASSDVDPGASAPAVSSLPNR